jgi:CHAT domain-containing protein
LLQTGFTSITIGDANSSGAVTLAGDTTFNAPVTLQAPVGEGSIDTTGGTLTGAGNATITLLANQTITTGDIINPDQAITITSTSGAINTKDLNAGAIALTTSGGDVNLSLSGNLPLSNPTIFTNGGEVTITSPSTTTLSGSGVVQTNGGDINLSGSNIDATALTLNSSNPISQGGDINASVSDGTVVIGNLNSSGLNGGNIFIEAELAITTGAINSSGSSGDGGNVTLDPIGDIQVTSINAQGGSSGRGGNVDITAGQFFQATDTFIDRNGIEVSISTSGGNGGGDVTIRHGGNGTIPFEVGDATTNGTAGGITSGDFTIAPSQSFLFTRTEGNIQIISADAPTIPPEPIPEPRVQVPERTPNQTSLSSESQEDSNQLIDETPILVVSNTTPVVETEIPQQEGSFTEIFENYLGIEERTSPVTLEQAQVTLQTIQQATGVKPAIIYAFFVPSTADSETSAKSYSDKNPNSSPTLWQFNSFNFSSTAEPTLSTNQSAQATDQLELVIITPDGQSIRRQVPGATREKVLNATKNLRRAITNIRVPRPYQEQAQQLYQWLVAPIEEDLQAQQIDNLVFSLDSGLRSLPIAALHDGNGFIVERYSIGLIPSLSLTDTRYTDVKNLQVLAMGASQFTDQNPLPAVPMELSVIVGQLWQGQSFLNEEFTLDNLKTARASQPFGIIHFATHGEFKPGEPENSYIQFEDTKLRLDQLQDLKLNDPPVELMVLSACRTALGDEEAELGFTGLAVQAGVKSALGSLWYVSDEGTLGFMTQFYEQLKQAPIKVEALRQAQLAMLRGEVRLENGQLVTPNGTFPLPPELAELGDKKLSHPYYWSAFTLVGNPW